MLTLRAAAPLVAAAIVLSAGTTAAHAQGMPTYQIEARFVPLGQLVDGMTRLTLTLQARAIFNGPFPADTPTSAPGNYGIFSLGYGPPGPTAPSRITRTGNIAGTSFERGDWGPYHVEPDDGNPPYDVLVRGATPGAQLAPNSPLFRRGFRFFNNDVSAALDNPTGNGNASDGANGAFDADGNLTNFNLLRDDFHANPRQQRNLTEPDGSPAWQDIYRLNIVDPRGMSFQPFGAPAYTVNLDGWIRAANLSTLVGNWTLASGDAVHATAGFNIYLVPAPISALPLAALGVVLGRRRR